MSIAGGNFRVVLAAWGCLWLAGCGGQTGAPTGEGELSGVVQIDGSSTVYPVTEAVAEEFQSEMRGKVKVTVGIAGTGGGFKRFCRGEIDVTGASRPILVEELELARASGLDFIELPICFDALTVAVNPANTWVDSISISDLKKIWEPSAQGTITRWNQIRPEWPDEELVLFGAGADSGTFDYFTEAVVGHAKASRGDFTGSEDDNTLVQGIAGTKSALGFLPYSYYIANADKLKALAIEWDKAGPAKGVLPSAENVLNGSYQPLSRPMFLYVSKAAVARPEVKRFVEFYIDNAAELSAEVQYLPLPKSAYETIRARFEALQVGSAFGGVPEVGLTVDEILSREPKS